MTNNVQLPDSDMWMVRAERGGMYIQDFLGRREVSIGWGDVGPINPTDSDDDIRHRCAVEYPGEIHGWHIIRRFAREVKIGDTVVTYNPGERIYHIGIIQSQVEQGPMAFAGRHSGYVRRVEWVSQISRDALSTYARSSLGGQLTVFHINTPTAQELRQRCLGESIPVSAHDEIPAPRPEVDTEIVLGTTDILQGYIAQSDQFVEDAISKLGPYQLQELVAGILRAMGYRTTISGPGPDRGVDIFASPDGLGLSDPRIFVEVKHRAGATGTPAIRSFLGGRRPGDRCLYISTGGFSSEARYEAARSQIPLTLIAMPELRELLVNYYETLDAETRALVPLKKVYWPVAE